MWDRNIGNYLIRKASTVIFSTASGVVPRWCASMGTSLNLGIYLALGSAGDLAETSRAAKVALALHLIPRRRSHVVMLEVGTT